MHCRAGGFTLANQSLGGQHLGNLLGIGSFIAYGLLCTLVGYFAPAPPRAVAEEANA